MFMSCVLVTNAIRCGATTCVGSDASQIGVSLEDPPAPVSPTSPWQPNARAAHSGSTPARHRVETEKRLAYRIEEPPTEGDT